MCSRCCGGGRHGAGRARRFSCSSMDAAALQLGIGDNRHATARSPQLSQRGESGLEFLRSGRPAIIEECVDDGHARQILLTAHRPVRIADRSLLISSSADISEQKSLRGPALPLRLLRRIDRPADAAGDRASRQQPPETRRGRRDVRACVLDVDNFKHINDYYGHSVGDALLVEIAKRSPRPALLRTCWRGSAATNSCCCSARSRARMKVEEFLQSTLSRLAAPFFIEGSEIFASTSIGVSLYPDHGRSLRRAAPERGPRDVPRQETTARARLPFSTPPWSTRRWLG